MNDTPEGTAPCATALYRLEGVRVERGGRALLDVDALEIGRGDIVAVTGPNGAGKTTLLRLLAFLLPPDAGVLSFEGTSLPAGAVAPLPLRRRVTLVAQDPFLFSGTVLRNAAWGPSARGAARTEAEARAREALDRVGLAGFERRGARTLSGGETRRLAVARALATNPSVLLLDEPAANLDAENRRLVEAAVRWANGEKGTTVVVSTHDPDQALRLAARRIELGAGKVAGDVRDNVFRGVVEIEGDRAFLLAAGGARIALAEGIPGPASVALAPSAVLLSLEPPRTSAQNVLRGTVARLSETEGRVRATVDAGVPIEAVLTRASAKELGLEPGKEVYAVFKATAVRLL
jgi:tungstate transport system ATP-binding protein